MTCAASAEPAEATQITREFNAPLQDWTSDVGRNTTANR